MICEIIFFLSLLLSNMLLDNTLFFHSCQTVHTYLMETYGLPIWGSYIIFALFTIVLGALLGLVN